MADTEHPNPIPSVRETYNSNPTHPILVSPNTSQNEPDIDPPSDRIRHSKYPLRFREPKRQWDESLLSQIEPYEPETYKDAMTSPNPQRWKQAIQEENDSLLHNNTWSPVQKVQLKNY